MSTLDRTTSSLLGSRTSAATRTANATATRTAKTTTIAALSGGGIIRVTPPGPVPSTKALKATEAFLAMEAGAIVRRIGPDNMAGKYHRIYMGVVQSSDNENTLASGTWHTSKTDVACWYGSTFRRIKVKVVEVDYE